MTITERTERIEKAIIAAMREQGQDPYQIEGDWFIDLIDADRMRYSLRLSRMARDVERSLS